MKPVIFEREQLNGLPVHAEVMKAWVAMHNRNLVDPKTVAIYGSDSVLEAAVDGEFAGFITYRVHSDLKQIWIALGWVMPDFRRNGVYRALYERLCSIRKEKFPDHTILGGTHVDNKDMLAVMKKLGRKKTNIIFES